MTKHKASPYSSQGGASVEGTPDTGLTAFSPEDSKNITSYPIAKSAATPLKSVHDPFVSTSTKPKAEQKLSATATSFQPFGLNYGSLSSAKSMTSTASGSSAPIPGTAQHLQQIIAAEENSPRRRAQTEITKSGTFTTDTRAGRHIKISSIFLTDVSQVVQASMDKHNSSDYLPHGTFRWEHVDNVVYMRIAHIEDAVMIYNTITRDHDNLAVEFIQPNEFGEISSPVSDIGKFSAYEGQIVVQARYPAGYDKKYFEADVRAFLNKEIGSLCAWEKISSTEIGVFHMVAEFHDASLDMVAVEKLKLKMFEGPNYTTSLSVTLHRPHAANKATLSRTSSAVPPTPQTPDSSGLSDAMGSMSVSKGKAPEVPSNFVPFATPTKTPSGLAFMPTTNNGFSLTGAVLVPSSAGYSPIGIGQAQQPRVPELPALSPFSMTSYSPLAHASYAGQGQSPTRYFQPELNQALLQQQLAVVRGPYGSPSPGPSRQVGYLSRTPNSGRRQNAGRVPYSVAMGYRGHNHVDLNAIHWGIDVRTTVMLRNIPNKVTQAQLKEIVDRSSFGRYDFMYLRIDFSNGCNVGYAFINFADPLDIMKFTQARSGAKWDAFRSDKVAEVSYATIQGRDCLIQKFRNSSVMLEPEYCRPKLFFIFPHPLVGQEDRFPDSDNPSKLRRSCENAEHVGLFAPSAGQHLRDEQRRRRSQYDRGTSLAEQEEYGLDLQPWSGQRSYQ